MLLSWEFTLMMSGRPSLSMSPVTREALAVQLTTGLSVARKEAAASVCWRIATSVYVMARRIRRWRFANGGVGLDGSGSLTHARHCADVNLGILLEPKC